MLLEIPELILTTGIPYRHVKLPPPSAPKAMASFSDNFTSLSVCSEPVIFWIDGRTTASYHRCPKFHPFKFRPFHWLNFHNIFLPVRSSITHTCSILQKEIVTTPPRTCGHSRAIRRSSQSVAVTDYDLIMESRIVNWTWEGWAYVMIEYVF